MNQHECGKPLWPTVLGVGETPTFPRPYLHVLTMKVKARSPRGSDRMRRVVIKYTQHLLLNEGLLSSRKDFARALSSWRKLNKASRSAPSSLVGWPKGGQSHSQQGTRLQENKLGMFCNQEGQYGGQSGKEL